MTKEIPIQSKGQTFIALVDDEDYPVVSRHKWYILYSNKRPYAFTRLYNEDAKNGKTLLMHHLIMGTTRRHDHKDNNSLNNQKSNLRRATAQQNNINKPKRPVGRDGRPSSSQYKGVTRCKDRFRAVIGHNYKVIQLGTFDTKEEAAIAYNAKARELYGEYAWLNPVPAQLPWNGSS